MSEPQLLRTALVIPPRGRKVLCCWAALPGVFLAPFVFWQSAAAGLVFCLLWAALVWGLRLRACSFVAALRPAALTVEVGITFPVRRVLPRRAVTHLLLVRTPLLRLAGASLLVVDTPGVRVVLPAVDAAQAEALAVALRREAGL